jgi:hypothetical protein
MKSSLKTWREMETATTVWELVLTDEDLHGLPPDALASVCIALGVIGQVLKEAGGTADPPTIEKRVIA